MAVCWVILRGQHIYTVIQAVHSLLYIVAKCHSFSVVTWKDKLFTKMWGMHSLLWENVLSRCWTASIRSRAGRRHHWNSSWAAVAVTPLGLLHMRYTLMHTSTDKVVYAPVVCHNSPATSSGVRSIWGRFAPFKLRACSTGQPTSCHELRSPESVDSIPRQSSWFGDVSDSHR